MQVPSYFVLIYVVNVVLRDEFTVNSRSNGSYESFTIKGKIHYKIITPFMIVQIVTTE